MIDATYHERLAGGKLRSVYSDIHDERRRAHTKHGAKGNSREDAAWSDPQWLAILGEEYGEVCHELTYDSESKLGSLRAELVQVAAMATAWIEAIDECQAK